ncbi:MAG: hypothetical protein FMNOHCHN_00717 [Ignavibacteriaceae bacterium]|nr:hypothetical protein [Ignavibacteriaceae bacterium]
MIKINQFRSTAARVLLLLAVIFAVGAYSGDGVKRTGNSLYKSSAEFFVFNINNLNIPVDNKGVIADVDPGTGAGGFYDGKVFLFSGGFFMSGITNGAMWANGVLSASRIEDYQPGPVGSSRTDPKNKMYVVTAQDEVFGPAWQEWKTAVSIGADFYDGDGDGAYNPVDLNGNGKWDSNEDRPDLIGDVTAWTVYNDGVAKSLRRFTDVEPQGIEIRQTVFAFASKGVVGNMLFIRYRIVNRGTVADKIDSVYFSVAADPDLGDYTDDLVGCDTTLSAGYVYNGGPDGQFGANCPTFLMDFFQGPVVYIPGETFVDANGNGEFDAGETPLTEAHNVRGVVMGIDTIPGAKNMPLTSFTQYMQSHPTHGDPNTRFELRNYLLGGVSKDGVPLDPCTWAFGNGPANAGVCATWDPKFMYSGKPEDGTGWLNTTPIDQRQMSNTGPFVLKKDQPIDIVAAYVVGRHPSLSVQSVRTAKEYDQIAQLVFDSNFPSPPAPPPAVYDVKTGNGFIDLTWQTAPQVNYRAIDTVLDIDRRLQGYYVTAFRTNSKADMIGGTVNSTRLVTYEMDNIIHGIQQKKSNGAIETYLERPSAEYLLDSALYSKPDEGRIRLRVTQDPFTGVPLVKGKEYYFALTTFTLNHKVIKNKATGTYGPAGDYIDETNGAVDEYETAIIRVVYGTDLFAPASDIGQSKKAAGFAGTGGVKFLPVNNSELTGDTYTVSFKADTTTIPYSASYSLTNNRTGTVLISDSKAYNFDSTNYAGKLTEGFVLKVKDVAPTVSTDAQQTYTPAANKWFVDLNLLTASLGAVYSGRDIAGVGGSATLGNRQSTITKANRLRAIEVRFGQPGKAYRYMNGFVGTSALSRRNSFKYAAGLNGTDVLPSRGGAMGQFGVGFVDVPFQVWVKDSVYGEERQLAVGFVEKSANLPGGNPDGNWFPGTDVTQSLEAIIVFDANYDASGSQIEYTGGVFGSDSAWADIRGYQFPASATTVTDEQKRIAASPLFNAMYVISLSALTATSTFTAGDVFRVPVGTYPYTDADSYTFSTKQGGALTDAEQKDLFNKVNVYPNPLFAFNPETSYNSQAYSDDPFVTFTNLPEEVTVKIFTVSGALVRTLTQADKLDGVGSPFLRWDLENENGLRVASGMYLAIVSSPGFGEKILKFGVILPQKQLQRY